MDRLSKKFHWLSHSRTAVDSRTKHKIPTHRTRQSEVNKAY